MNPEEGELIRAKQDVMESCDCSGGTAKVAIKNREYKIIFKGFSGSHFRNELGTLSKYNPKYYEKV